MEVGVLRVQEVRELKGDAQFAMVRGRERRFYDFAFKLRWGVKVEGRKYSGELAYEDVSTSNPDWDEENCELSWKVPTRPTAAQRDAFGPLVAHMPACPLYDEIISRQSIQRTARHTHTCNTKIHTVDHIITNAGQWP